MKERFKRINKIPILIGLIALFLIGTAVTYASFTTQDVKSNDLRVGLLRGDINEDFTATTEVGEETKKVVTVKNTGNLTLFLRVMIFPEISIKSTSATTSSDEADKILPSVIGEQILLDLGGDWIDGKDGYYYYSKPLPVKEITTPLIDKVKIDFTKTNPDYTGADLNITVRAETVSTVDYSYRETWWGSSDAPASSELQQIDTLLDAQKD